jgi:hypothetical protein
MQVAISIDVIVMATLVVQNIQSYWIFNICGFHEILNRVSNGPHGPALFSCSQAPARRATRRGHCARRLSGTARSSRY